MGICVSGIYFKNGLPPFEKIRTQFKKQTGLALSIRASINFFGLPSDNSDAVNLLAQDVGKYETIMNDHSNCELEEMWEEIAKLNYVVGFHF